MLTEALKERTESHHRNIESVERLCRVFAEDYSLEEYTDLLSRFYGFYAPLETQFLKNGKLLQALHYQERCKVPLLKQDLAHLGLSLPTFEQLPLCRDLPLLETDARMVGCMYVLEGSTMGGQMISKHLSNVLNLDGEKGLSFYICYGKETMARWREFKQFIDDSFKSQSELDELSSAATETFEALQRWLNQA